MVLNDSRHVVIQGKFNGKVCVIDKVELIEQLNLGNTSNLPVTCKHDNVSSLQYKYNHGSAERLRQLSN